jgi:NAD-dependent dihydropyrimidine dehydrogenase PreA subunit
MAKRNIIQIDDEKCDGCGQCVTACAEGAVKIIQGKARLVSDSYCDGLGACLGKCPHNAITVIQREATDFDEVAVRHHMALASPPHHTVSVPISAQVPIPVPIPDTRAPHDKMSVPLSTVPLSTSPSRQDDKVSVPLSEDDKVSVPLGTLPLGTLQPKLRSTPGCPGTAIRSLIPELPDAAVAPGLATLMPAQLRNWPVQLHLAPTKAHYFHQAQLLLAADCVPFAYPDFHRHLLAGKILLIACPKLDDTAVYREKLVQIVSLNELRSIEIAIMEVPCCGGLVQLVKEALAVAGKNLPVKIVRVGIQGRLIREIPG